jgi:hypothetical protein
MSDETKHAPEPWRSGTTYGAYGRLGTITDATGLTIDWCIDDDSRRRIVACVNACAGLPVEALEAGALADLIADVVVMRLAVDLTHPVSVEAGQRVDAALRALGVLP